MSHLLDLKHLKFLTDDFGIWQHTSYAVIDKKHGYSLDDNARALLVAIEYKELELAKIYLSFIERCIYDPENIINFYGPDREPQPEKGWSQDALGQVYWALALCLEKNFQVAHALKLAKKIEPVIFQYHYIRGIAYALIGAITLNKKLAIDLADRILLAYRNKRPDWHWPENKLTYANAIIPYSLLKASQELGDSTYGSYLETGLQSQRFLNHVKRLAGIPDDIPVVIGNKGWWEKEGQKPLYDQQPVDAAYMIMSNILAYEISHDQVFKKEALLFYSWFWGNNTLKEPLIVDEDSSVLDGLQETGPSQNRGSENIICFLLAQKALEPYLISSPRA